MPVGGASTHAVLTGHRGVPGSLLFTRLDELQVGDSFYIEVMGEELGYKIDRIDVIEPDDDSKLRVTAGEDRVTLMTCTPYGVNSHRLLVSGVRADIPNEVPVPDDMQGINTTAVALGVLGALLAIVVGLVAAGHVRKKRRAAQRAAVAAAVTLDAGAAAGDGGNGWTAGASRPAAPFASSASASSASPDSDADSPEYRGRHLR